MANYIEKSRLVQDTITSRTQLLNQYNGSIETGYIDLLYRHNDLWALVDFKTDKIRDDAALQRLLAEKDYIQQIRQYGTAVQHLLRVTPKLMLVFLNFENKVRVVTEYLAN